MSDSECESVAAQNVIVKTTKKASSGANKRKSSNNTNLQRNSIKKLKAVDIFGLCDDEDYKVAEVKNTKLSSYIINRVANGSQRRLAPTTGDFYVELKVYHREDAEASSADERWKKALLRLTCQLENESTQWRHLQRFVKEAHILFEDASPTFYNDK